MITMRIKRLRDGVILPRYAHHGDAGLDLYTPIKIVANGGFTFATQNRAKAIGGAYNRTSGVLRVPLGFALEIPHGHFGWITNKSSRFYQGLHVHGIIDSNYRGEVSAQIRAEDAGAIEADKKLCQLIIVPCERVMLHETDELSPTVRGEGGYGSTGYD